MLKRSCKATRKLRRRFETPGKNEGEAIKKELEECKTEEKKRTKRNWGKREKGKPRSMVDVNVKEISLANLSNVVHDVLVVLKTGGVSLALAECGIRHANALQMGAQDARILPASRNITSLTKGGIFALLHNFLSGQVIAVLELQHRVAELGITQ